MSHELWIVVDLALIAAFSVSLRRSSDWKGQIADSILIASNVGGAIYQAFQIAMPS